MAKQGKGMGCLKVVGIILLVFVLLIGAIALGGSLGAANSGKTLNDVVDAMSSDSEPSEEPSSSETNSGGQVVYDGDDMKITYLRMEEAQGIEAATIYFEVENKTGEKATAGPEVGSVDVNGYNVTTMGGAIAIDPGNKAIAPIIMGYK